MGDELSLKQAALNIIEGLRNKQQWQETKEGLGRVQDALPGVAESLGRGAIAQVPGAFGDIESLGRAGINWLADKEKVSPKTTLPTTREILDFVPRMTKKHEGAETMEDVGGLIAPGMGGVVRDVVKATEGLPVGNMMIGKNSKLWNPEWEAAYNERVPAGSPDPIDHSIWRETKTYRGTDGQLRQELDDSKMMANYTPTPASRAKQKWDEMQALRGANNPDPNVTFPAFKDMDRYSKKSLTKQAEREMYDDGSLTLGANVKHPQIYDAYPGIEKLKFLGKRGEESGHYAPGREIRAANTNKEGLTSVAAHEIQHAIQQAEGFGRGGSPARSAPFTSEEAWGKQADQLREVEGKIANYEAMLERLRGGEQIPVSTITNNPEHTQPLREGWLQDQIRINNYNAVQNGRHLSYLAEPGEAESRMVQKRLRMSPQERMATHPLLDYDLPLEKVKGSIFANKPVPASDAENVIYALKKAPKLKEVDPVDPTLIPAKSKVIMENFPEVEPDMARSMESFKGGVPMDKIQDAIKTRAAARAEPMPAGKPVSQLSDEELAAYGAKYGVDFSQSPMVDVVDPATGKTWQIPGGLDGKFSYPDLHRLKAQAYNPNDFSDDFHAQLQKKMTASVTPDPDKLDDMEIYNRTLMGAASPNTPLLANQFQVAALRQRTPEGLKEFGSRIGDNPASLTKEQRKEIELQIAKDYNLGAASTGRLSARSSVDMSNYAEMAKKMSENPDFYRKRPDETWQQAAERVGNVTRGLSAKTGSFGVVWQNPAEATTSAMDRHMARNYFEKAKQDPEIMKGWEENWGPLWNSQIDTRKELTKQLKAGEITKEQFDTKTKILPPVGAKKVKNFAQLDAQDSLDWQLGRVETEVAQHQGGKYRLANGEINPRVPEHLRDLPGDQKDFFTFGELYKNMLNSNEVEAQKHGLNIFGEQWRKWDRIRGQLEPHEAMYPGLHKLPKLSTGELIDALNTQNAAGFSSSNGATKPYEWKKGFYHGVGAAPVAGSMYDNESTKQ